LPHDPARATELLYQRHGATVFRYAWHLLGRREDAEDASQATFLAVHRALGAGTAVLEPGAWVLRIARNECLGRLRQRTPPPQADSLERLAAPIAGGPERLVEVRDQMRAARDALRSLPVQEREAFVLREWLGLRTAEVALTMGLTPTEIESLAGRARRSLVLAVGGLEPAVGCAGTRAALEAGSLDRAGTVHLLRCPVCRGVRRALRPPADDAAARAPIAVVGQRLAGALPGFASGGGGIVAVLTTKAAAAPLLAKTAALVVAALATAGVAQQEIHNAGSSQRAAARVQARGGEAHALAAAPVAKTKVFAHAPLTPVSQAAAPKAERRTTQLIALSVPAVSHVRGGVASTNGTRVARTTPVTSSGGREADTSRSSGAGADPGSDGNTPRDDTHSGSASAPPGGSTTDTPVKKASEAPSTKTDSSGSDDRQQASQHVDASRSSGGGSGNDGGSATSDASGNDGSTHVSDQPVTTTGVGGSNGRGDEGSKGSSGSDGPGSSPNVDGAAGSPTFTTGAPAVVPQTTTDAAAVVPPPATGTAAAVPPPASDG
jgi:RNA polymerase sigma-70 factor (ECF subfamily)